jgi:hypothetical protein
MTTKKEGAQSPDQAAPQAISTADSTAPETPRADLLAWLAILAAFALAGWLEGVAR